MSTLVSRFQIGAVRCAVIGDGDFEYRHPAQFLFANAPQGELSTRLSERGIALEGWDRYLSPYSALLVDDGSRRLMVDAGAGSLATTTGKLCENLRAAGYKPEEIDTVVITHIHPDHAAGALDAEGKPTFPNARYIASRAEWEFWSSNPSLIDLRVPEHFRVVLKDSARRTIDGLRHRAELVQGDEGLSPGISVVPAPGHTPGQVAILVSSEGRHLLHVSDAILHPLQIERPDWWSCVDWDPVQTVATRRRLLSMASGEKALVLAMHFDPFPSLGYLTEKGASWTWQPLQQTP